MDQLKKLIYQTKGKIFKIAFVKKDGSLRVMNCRLGVKRHVKGTGRPRAKNDDLITVFEMGNSYRTVRLDSILYFKKGNTVWYK